MPQKELGCRKWGCNKWGFKRCLWKSAKIGLFRPFFGLSGGCEEHLGKPESGRKKPFSSDILRYPQICLNPHLLNSHLRHFKGARQKGFDHFFFSFSGLFRSLFGRFSDVFCQNPFAGPPLPQGESRGLDSQISRFCGGAVKIQQTRVYPLGRGVCETKSKKWAFQTQKTLSF